MKNRLFLTLSLASLAFTGLCSFANGSPADVKADSVTTEYVNLGPGVFNPESGQPGDLIQTDNYSLAYRAKYLALFMDNDMYMGVDFAQSVSKSDMADTDLSLIRIYTDETHFQTVDKIIASNGASLQYNIFHDACLNLGIPILTIEPQNLYMVTIAEGFVYPYAPGSDHGVRYVQSATISYKNSSYGKSNDLYYSSDWYSNKELTGGIKEIPTAAFTDDSHNGDYHAHIRGNQGMFEDEGPDNGSCFLILFFGGDDYNEDIRGQTNVQIPEAYFDLSEKENSFLNQLYRKVHFMTRTGEYLTLEDVSNPKTKGLPYYNLWGEKDCIAFPIGNLQYLSTSEPYYVDDVSYNAMSFEYITVDRGAQFPAYVTTNGDSVTDYRYTQVDTIKLDLSGATSNYWLTQTSRSFVYGDTLIEKLDACTETVNVNGEDVTKTFINIYLEENNFTGLSNSVSTTLSNDLLRYVYVNGRSLTYKNDGDTIAVTNLNGREGCLSLSVDNETVDSITEIIVQKGCYIPAASEGGISMEVYGESAYYNVLKSLSYSKSSGSGEFEKSESVVWTVWFDGANPVRVKNAKYLDIDGIETPVKDHATFKKWTDESGAEISGNVQIYSGKEYFADYTYSHTVKLINGKDTTTVEVERYSRLTSDADIYSKLYPVQDGYRFLGWFDEDGNRFNIDNQIVRDMTLTAAWEAGSDDSSSKGCSGSIAVTSALLSGLSLMGIALILAKKYRQD